MATLKQIRGRIRAAKNIQQITKAMKLVSAARLRKATDRVLDSRPYAEKLQSLIQSLSAAGDLPPHPLLENRPVNRICLILITSDRGLAGSYNSSLIRKASDFIRGSAVPVALFTVGRKGTQFFSRRNYNIVHSMSVPSAGARLQDAIDVSKRTRAMFESVEVDAIYVCYSQFHSAIRQVPTIVRLLPIEPPKGEEAAPFGTTIKFEPDPATLLDNLLPRYFLTLVQQAMLEATASEFAARMTAMTSATDNAGKMIQSLTLKANRERQAGITKEILEVVGGAEALAN